MHKLLTFQTAPTVAWLVMFLTPYRSSAKLSGTSFFWKWHHTFLSSHWLSSLYSLFILLPCYHRVDGLGCTKGLQCCLISFWKWFWNQVILPSCWKLISCFDDGGLSDKGKAEPGYIRLLLLRCIHPLWKILDKFFSVGVWILDRFAC